MRRAGAGIIVAAGLLALAGCKSTDPKDDKTGGLLSKSKGKDKDKDAPGKGGSWLDDVGKLPGAGTGIPKGADPKTAAQDSLGGRVLDPDGRPARNVFVRIEQVGAGAGTAPLGIYTKADGYFSASGFKPGQAYELTAEATTTEGRKLSGIVQTRVPNAVVLLLLRDDLAPGGAFPPAPKPADKVNDGAWGPNGPATGVPPPSIGGAPKVPTPPGVLPPPDDISVPPPDKPLPKPENTADVPKDPFKAPPVNIPGPGPAPYAPPPLPPLPGGLGPTGRAPAPAAGAKLALVDTLERPWGLDAVEPGGLVLVEFATTTCIYCPQVLPLLKDLQARYGARGLQVAGVLCDDLPQKARAARAAKYARDHDLNYAMFVEAGDAGTVRDRYEVPVYPYALLLNASGKVLWRGHPGKELAKLEAAIKQNLGK
jgi:thiol-disulfide isomerase/thioredoxin